MIARRYRPQTFDQLVGQEHITRPLRKAIETNRVGHAYLFCGRSGTGKTSMARIFAKALQCVHGPTTTPCNQCDICQGISSGDDVDTMEINGVRYRGSDNYAASWFNVNTRPFRARFKIYIVDRVDFLTTAEFGLLSDILEEPSAHVKFIFCTTDPERLPRVILERLQRFNFFPVAMPSIVELLQHIVDTEGARAEPEALKILAQQADGSVRESQSLLESLLSACGGDGITVESVHQMLGTADSGLIRLLFDRLISRDVTAALSELDAAMLDGVDAGRLVEQLLGHYRDLATVLAGCPAELMHFLPTSDYEQILAAAKDLGLTTILAAMQILVQTEALMRQRGQGRMHTELALMQICSLESLDDLSSVLAWLRGAD